MRRPSDIKGLFIVYYGYTVLGKTYAKSAKQAVNNVRHNLMGDTTSQYADPGMWNAIENTELQEEAKC